MSGTAPRDCGPGGAVPPSAARAAAEKCARLGTRSDILILGQGQVWDDFDHKKFADLAEPIIRAAIEAERERGFVEGQKNMREAAAKCVEDWPWHEPDCDPYCGLPENVRDIPIEAIRQRSASGEAPSGHVASTAPRDRGPGGAVPPSELDAQERMRRAIVQRFKDWHDKENVIPVIMGVRNDAGKVGYSYTEIHGENQPCSKPQC